MSTPSRSRSSTRGGEDHLEWREAIKRQQLESERQMQALLQEIARLREKTLCCEFRLHQRGLLVVNAREAKEQTQGMTQSQYTLGLRGHPRDGMLDHKSDTRPCTKLLKRKAQTLLISRRRDSVTRDPSCPYAMPARLGPQEPGKTRPTVTTNWDAHPDPLVTPMVQNAFPHQAVRQARRNLLNEPLIGSISKRLDDMLSTPFCSHIIHYDPQGDFSCLNSLRTMGSATPLTISCITDSS
ncbi:hypothetical protein CK203_031897 [Vitis vinifera]|uniref:Uncharacterized protein n=1 Tax=Vitis vinifera TaxID=29760 RepID=A0A438IN83_VITVI|nr:hypothetical protein CK203_031897 [Vitis vinifera]